MTSKIGIVRSFRAQIDALRIYLSVRMGRQDLGIIIEPDCIIKCVRLTNGITALINLVFK